MEGSLGHWKIVSSLIKTISTSREYHLENFRTENKISYSELRVEEDVASDLVMKVDALLSAQPKGDTRIEYQFFEDRHSAIKLRPKEGRRTLMSWLSLTRSPEKHRGLPHCSWF
uniref:UDP-glucose:glycoprotein glucosyltransferase 2-like n=1 Tax=Castor canadensis TaxID=51338 RepID=A0A8B7UYA2_CASCN|nr:UDP-glucose:glycoprotein glucosyltransferase 2-like [Castor canadensis]